MEFVTSTSLEKRGARYRNRFLGFPKRVTLRLAVVAGIFVVMVVKSTTADPSQVPAQQPSNTAQSVDPQELMWWLPSDTESVVAARGPFLIPVGSNMKDNENDQAWFTKKTTLGAIRERFEELPLEVFYDLDLEKTMKNATVAYALQGSRHFRKPQGNAEVMAFEGCSILVFEKDLDPLTYAVEQLVAKIGARNETINGIHVMVIQEKSEGAVETRLLAFPRSNTLLVANNRQYLQEVLARMAQKKATRALPAQLHEWQFLDANVRFWGLRHFDPIQAKLDPTSPFGDDETFGPKDPKAIGVVFSIDPQNERRLIITQLSGDEARAKSEASLGKTVSESQEGVRFEIQLRNSKPGALEQIYTLDRSSTLDCSILAIEMAVGRGMYF